MSRAWISMRQRQSKKIVAPLLSFSIDECSRSGGENLQPSVVHPLRSDARYANRWRVTFDSDRIHDSVICCYKTGGHVRRNDDDRPNELEKSRAFSIVRTWLCRFRGPIPDACSLPTARPKQTSACLLFSL